MGLPTNCLATPTARGSRNLNKATHAHGGGSGWHQACVQYLDLSAAAVIAKSPLHYFLLFSVTAGL